MAYDSDLQEKFKSSKETSSDLQKTAYFLTTIGGVGLAGLLFWAMNQPVSENKFSIFGLGVLLAGSFALIGGVLGLLFGIPKSISDPTTAAAQSTHKPQSKEKQDKTAVEHETAATVNPAPRSSYSVNTNLEQISDWLTKIIVGVSLTQLPAIRESFFSAAKHFGQLFPASKAATAGNETAATVGNEFVAALLIAYGLAAGFLAGYLITRIYLPGAFNRADQLLQEIKTLKEEQSESKEDKQAIDDAAQSQASIYGNLYNFEKKGFEKAIKEIERLFLTPINTKNPALWTYLAAAHGQAYEWESKRKKNKAVLKTHRDEALKAVTETLTLGNEWKPVLQVMWDKNHPTKKGNKWAQAEDDLEVFYNDPDFKELLGTS